MDQQIGTDCVLERHSPTADALSPPGATPTTDGLPRRIADFDTLAEAVDYAARSSRGLNFHDARGALVRAYPYSELREDSLANAARLLKLGIKPGDRIALIAETCPEFAAAFFGAVYAGAWPVPLPLPTSFGGRQAYVGQLKVQLKSCDPVLLVHPSELAEYAADATADSSIRPFDWTGLSNLEQGYGDLPTASSDDIAYLQYSSGSTRFPHGVAITHQGLLENLRAHGIGLGIRPTDRCVSWLPWYHDMGLVGCLLSPLALQVSCDYQKTEDFARRPLAWLDIISRNPGTSISYSPTFGYDICARRMSSGKSPES